MAPHPSDGPNARLHAAHQQLRTELPAIVRIAAALYDRDSDRLKTFLQSTEGPNPLPHYDARLADVPSLARLAETGRYRIIDDLDALPVSDSVHSRALAGRFRSSYTRPVYDHDGLTGFLFFDADETSFFTPAVVRHLAVFSEFVGLLVDSSRFPVRILQSTVAVASRLSHSRDPETGAHLDRMARYSRLIALELADRHGLSDPWIEHLFLFAPLHDIGKVGIPDRVLLKPGKLDEEERAIMQGHVNQGTRLIESVLRDCGMHGLPFVDMLGNIVRHHHESWDGSGYPLGLRGAAIPIEARIVKVADVFDALTSARPYKDAWTVERAAKYLVEGRGGSFDAECVDAMLGRLTAVDEIRAMFPDTPESVGFHEAYDAVV